MTHVPRALRSRSTSTTTTTHGTSTSGTAGQDSPEETGREKRQKVLQDQAPQTAALPVSTAPVPCLLGALQGYYLQPFWFGVGALTRSNSLSTTWWFFNQVWAAGKRPASFY